MLQERGLPHIERRTVSVREVDIMPWVKKVVLGAGSCSMGKRLV